MKLLSDQVHYAAMLVGRMVLPGDARQMIVAKYGVDDRTARRLLRAGKRFLARWSDQPPEENYVESVAYYRSVLQSKAPERDKLVARQRLDQLMRVEGRPGRSDAGLTAGEVLEALANLVKRYEGTDERPASGVPPVVGEGDADGPILV